MIILNDEVVAILSSYHYQVASRKDIIIGVLNNTLNMDNERFNQYHAEYEILYRDYEIAKQELITPYLKENYPNFKSYDTCNWSLDFSTKELTFA